MKNKKGFTLVELLVVVVIMTLIMLMVVPSITKIYDQNNKKKYASYELMMTEYAKVDNPKKLKQDMGLCNLIKAHSELNEISEECKGYVEVNSDREFKAYLYCNDGKYETVKDHYKNNSSKYTTCSVKASDNDD